MSVLLDAGDTEALLRGAPTAYRTSVNDVLLAALAWALSRWTGRQTVSVELEGHGREEILDGVDLSRTVGWFTTMYPVTLEMPCAIGVSTGLGAAVSPGRTAGHSAVEAVPAGSIPAGNVPEGNVSGDDLPAGDGTDWRGLVKSVRRQLRAVPGNGFGFGALRWLGSAAARDRLPAGAPGPQIVFNYLGQWDARPQQPDGGLVHAVHGSLGQDHDPADRGSHLLEVVGAAQDGRLEFTWYYRPDLHEESTVESVAGDFAGALRRIAYECREAT